MKILKYTLISLALPLLAGNAAWAMCPSGVCSATLSDICNRPCRTIKRYPIRPQGRSKDRQMVGTARYTHDDEDKNLKFCLSATTEYARSYKPGQILKYLFGPDIQPALASSSSSYDGSCDRTIHIQGSRFIQDRDPQAWFADYFYLPRDFDATVSFSPRITNFLVDFDGYCHLNSCLRGLYARVYAPVVHAQWDLNMCETISRNAEQNTERTDEYPRGYFATCPIAKRDLVQTFTAYASGSVPADDYQVGQVVDPFASPATTEDPTHHITFQPLNAIRMTPFVNRKTGFADLRFELGWNIFCTNDYHLGINIQGAAPSGKRPDPLLLFDPIIGNGRHWEIGGGITAHYLFLQNSAETCQFIFHLDCNLTHILPAHEIRTFDLRDKPNSSYMLATKFRPNDGNPPFETLYAKGTTGQTCGSTPSHIFALEYAPVANLTTIDVSVSNDLHADLVGMVSVYTPRFSFDIGYNFWARTVETINFNEHPGACQKQPHVYCQPSQWEDKWALKGDARMFGYADDIVETPAAGTPQALSATESKADIHSGTNNQPLDFSNTDNNVAIDNTSLANLCAAGPIAVALLNQPDTTAGHNIQTSYEPLFITYEQLDLVGPRQMSHKLFAHFSFICDRDSWHPYLGIGGFVEMGRNRDCGSYSDCPYNMVSRVDCALSQWAVWFKTGVAFE